jgi:hypothetical protein
MLRVLYGLILRAHPAYFRQRFGEEMQSIFDQAENDGVALDLLVDAIVSLARQWTLRPQFWEEPPLAMAGQGPPLFSSLNSDKPRTAALVYGAFLSALVLNGICWTMGYAWNHPTFMELRRPVIRPPASWKVQTKGATPDEATETVEPELYADEGRVVLIFTAHPHTDHAAPVGNSSEPSSTASSAPANSSAPSSNLSATPSPGLPQSSVGTYISDSAGHERVNVTLNGGRLQLELVGVFSSPLTPVSGSQRLTCTTRDCSVTFSTNTSGMADQIEIHYGGHEIQAFRVQGAVF